MQPERGRPHMIRYGIAQGEKGMIEWAWVDEQLTKARNYWIATVTPDGKPHAAPVFDSALEILLECLLKEMADEESLNIRYDLEATGS